jgi:flagellum-specific ATP synthase
MSVHRFQERLRHVDPVLRRGRVRRILPTSIEADGPNVALGTLCAVETSGPAGRGESLAEVVRVNPDSLVLTPLEEGFTTFAGAIVRAGQQSHSVPAGPALLGRAVDALGRATDGLAPIRNDQMFPLHGVAPNPLDRVSPPEILETGIRAIDGLVTLGKGQRVGVFAASGVGKTTLVAQFARDVKADIVILCLVGERGREVEALWHAGLDADARARSTLVAATSNPSAAMRVRASRYALALAEYWRDKGKHVLLLLDSVTRLAMALRELGLAAGEPPTLRAYTPSVFAQLPKLVERCGALRAGGAISAIFTVLSETDDIDDPVSELMKSLLDGHIVLSRTLAEAGQFPAIDPCRSVSRQSDGLVPPAQRGAARQVLEWINIERSARTLVDAGLYAKGANPDLDRALEKRAGIAEFLKQDGFAPFEVTTTELAKLAGHHAR